MVDKPRRVRVRGLDCEMVGVGPKGKKSILARVSVVGRTGKVLLDCLVSPSKPVTDWRTPITGIDEGSFARTLEGPPGVSSGDALPVAELPRLVLEPLEAVRRTNALLDGAVVVGHDLRHDFKLLGRCKHRRLLLRDTAFCPLLSAEVKDSMGRVRRGTPSLRSLAATWLDDHTLHGGRSHDSVDDARTAMLLYRLIAPMWEKTAQKKWGAVPPEFLEAVPRKRKRSSSLRGAR